MELNCSSISFQLTSLIQFRVHESIVTYVIEGSRVLNQNKFVNWNDMKEHIWFQLGVLPVYFKTNCIFFSLVK